MPAGLLLLLQQLPAFPHCLVSPWQHPGYNLTLAVVESSYYFANGAVGFNPLLIQPTLPFTALLSLWISLYS